MEALYPALASIIGAFAAWNISSRQERQKSKQFDLEYVQRIVDEQLLDLKQERDRANTEMLRVHDETIQLRERIAVLEAQLREQERIREWRSLSCSARMKRCGSRTPDLQARLSSFDRG